MAGGSTSGYQQRIEVMTLFSIISLVIAILILFKVIELDATLDSLKREIKKAEDKITEGIPQQQDFKICGDYTFVLYDEKQKAICCGVDAAIVEIDGIVMIAVHGISFDNLRGNEDLLNMYKLQNDVIISFKHEEEDIVQDKIVKMTSFSIEMPLNALPIYEIEMKIEQNLTEHI